MIQMHFIIYWENYLVTDTHNEADLKNEYEYKKNQTRLLIIILTIFDPKSKYIITICSLVH